MIGSGKSHSKETCLSFLAQLFPTLCLYSSLLCHSSSCPILLLWSSVLSECPSWQLLASQALSGTHGLRSRAISRKWIEEWETSKRCCDNSSSRWWAQHVSLPVGIQVNLWNGRQQDSEEYGMVRGRRRNEVSKVATTAGLLEAPLPSLQVSFLFSACLQPVLLHTLPLHTSYYGWIKTLEP